MILDIENRGDHLNISYFDKEGNIAFKEIKIAKKDQFVWKICDPLHKAKDPTYTSWDKKPIRKSSSDKLNKYRIEEILLKTDPEETKEMYEFNIPKKFFMDIETEKTADGFASPLTAQNRVTAISFCSDSGNVFVLGLKDLTEKEVNTIEKRINAHVDSLGKKWSFKYIKYETEYDMIYTFFNKFAPKMPCISGWNFKDYDWLYLTNRCKRLSIDISVCSPSGKLIGKNKMPQHRLILDYLEIYKKWDVVVKLKENNKLDTVAEQATGINKIKYNGSLQELYEQQYEDFVYYSAIDSILVYFIDKKINTMNTLFNIANVAKCEVNRAFSPIWVTESFMIREFLDRNQVFLELENNNKQIAFAGAYVKDPTKGLHDIVGAWDFASLYPSIMRQWNISPESYIGKNIEPKEGQIKTAGGSVFDNSEDSVLRKILTHLYSMRKVKKAEYLGAEQEINYLKSLIK